MTMMLLREDPGMNAEPPVGGPIRDDDARALAELLARWAIHELDQFDHWKVETPDGPVYVQIANQLMPGVAEEVYTTIWPLPSRLRQSPD